MTGNSLPTVLSPHFACLLAGLLLTMPGEAKLSAAETNKIAEAISVVPSGVTLTSPGDRPGVPFVLPSQTKKSADPSKDDDKKRGEWLIAPLPSHSPTLGWTLGLPVCRLYRPAGVSDEAPAWATGVGGFYAENKSWGAGAFHKMNLGNDLWRILASAAYANLRYDYYGINGGGSDHQRSIALKQVGGGGVVEVLREVADHLYTGLRIVKGDTKISIADWPASIPPGLIPSDLGINISLLSFAPRLVYDTRNNEYYPTAGELIEGEAQISSKSMGSDLDYTRYELSWNHYLGLGTKGSLALRVVGKYASKGAPFFLYPAFGQSGDLRGYTPGTYRDQLLVATQAEYRYRVRKNLGFVVFAGVGGVGPTLSDFGRALPSTGVGFRYVLAEENSVSLRLDFAWGRNEQQFYVGLGEAF